MGRRILRAAIVIALAAALLVIARPARAALAPFCDDRGASAVAAPPLLEAPDDVLRRVRATCNGDEPLVDASVVPARRLSRSGSAPVDASLATLRASQLAPPRPRAAGTPPTPAVGLPEGVGLRVERPPRG